MNEFRIRLHGDQANKGTNLTSGVIQIDMNINIEK